MNSNYTFKRINQTIEIINNLESKSDNYMTMLMNSLLSLIVLPIEELKRDDTKRFFGDRMVKFYKQTGIVPIKFDPQWVNENNKLVNQNRIPKNFFIRLRNSISHQNIEETEIDGVTYITFFNQFKQKGRKEPIVDFIVKVSDKELKKLSLFIGRTYLNCFQK